MRTHRVSGDVLTDARTFHPWPVTLFAIFGPRLGEQTHRLHKRSVTELTPTGFEASDISREKAEITQKAGAVSEAPCDDSRLRDVIAAWPTLPENVKQQIAALVKTAR